MSAADTTVKSLMQWPVAMVGESTSMRMVADALVADEVGALAVVSDDRLIGVIAERDIVRQVVFGADPDHTLAGDMMSTEPVTVAPGDSVQHASDLMREAGVRHLPVLDGDDLVGFISIRDLIDVRSS